MLPEIEQTVPLNYLKKNYYSLFVQFKVQSHNFMQSVYIHEGVSTQCVLYTPLGQIIRGIIWREMCPQLLNYRTRRYKLSPPYIYVPLYSSLYFDSYDPCYGFLSSPMALLPLEFIIYLIQRFTTMYTQDVL